MKVELLELQQMYDSSQRERQTLEEELRRCREQLQEVLGRKRQVRQVKSQGSEIRVTPVFLPFTSLHLIF